MQYISVDSYFQSSINHEVEDGCSVDQSLCDRDNSGIFSNDTSPYSTDTDDIIQTESENLSCWQECIPTFVNLLHHTSFEDGISNDAIEWVQQYYRISISTTLLWLYSIQAQYQKDSIVLDSLLRILAYIEVPQVYAITMVPLVELALSKESCQESAIMLCEIWRSRECLVALKGAQITNFGVKKYAEKVICELSNELSV